MALQIAVAIPPIRQGMPGLPAKKCNNRVSVSVSDVFSVCSLYSAVNMLPLGFSSVFSFGSAVTCYRPEIDSQKIALVLIGQAGL